MQEMMNAVRIHEFGEPEVLIYEAVPKPVPMGDEVLIRVHAAGINPVDCKTRRGEGLAWRYPNPFPLILGWDVSGVIEEIGTTVTDFNIGDEVYGMVSFPEIGAAYAEYVTASPHDIALKPASVDHVQAAALPLVGLTAWQALFDNGDLSAWQRVLIHAAAGGVGHIAVQLAKWKGSTVLGTASPRNEAFLGSLGVDQFINYQDADFLQDVSEVDVVLDPISGETRDQSWVVIKPNGILVSIVGEPSAEKALEHAVRGARMLVRPNAAQLREMAQLVDNGQLSVKIDQVLPLQQAAQAHRLSQAGHTQGKLVLQVVG